MLNVLKQIADQLLSPDKLVRKRYQAFRTLLEHDRAAHRCLSDLEQLHYRGKAVDLNRLRYLFSDYSAQVKGMIDCLDVLSGGGYHVLQEYYRKFDFYGRFALAPPAADTSPPYSVTLDPALAEQDCDESSLGGKGRNLALLLSVLQLPVPPACIITTSAWNYFLEQNGLRPLICRELAAVDLDSYQSLQRCSALVRERILAARLPAELREAVRQGARQLKLAGGGEPFAVRSSSVAEDSSCSFAGQYASLLHVDADGLEAAWLEVVASKYSPEALQYRILNGLDDESTPMAVIIQPMVGGAVSGVIVTDSQGNHRIDYVAGYGDGLLGGTSQSCSLRVRCREGEHAGPLAIPEQLTEKELRQLSCWADIIAEYYQEVMEIEWTAAAGASWVLQARPHSAEKETTGKAVELPDLPLLFQGGETASYGRGWASGISYILSDIKDIGDIPEGALLICDDIPPALVAVIPKLCGVIAGKGSRADHFSSVAREFGLPLLVKAADSLAALPGGEPLTLFSAERSVYSGAWQGGDRHEPQLQLSQESPVARALKMVVEFSSPLQLTDIQSKDFRPEGCRSLHDIVRFAHEKSVQAMFLSNPDTFFRKPGSRQLESGIPLQMHIIDLAALGRGGREQQRNISLTEVQSPPFQALWSGLTCPGSVWGDKTHYDWQSYDAVALAGGIAGKEDGALASYAMVSSEYLNVHFRFGYHFTLIDCLCSGFSQENYLLLRFAGGGGTARGKGLRIDCLERIMTRLGCVCERSGDLLDCRHSRLEQQQMLKLLDQVGRMLAASRVLDMVLADAEEVNEVVEAFFAGRYHFLKG